MKRLIFIIWLAGTCAFVAYAAISNLLFWQTIKTEKQLTKQDVLELLETCKKELGIQTIIGVFITDKISSPSIFGFIRPRLLIPLGLIERTDYKELRYIFLHELIHIKNRDILLAWLLVFIQSLHWFNPLIWFAIYRIRTEREMITDEIVLRYINKEERNGYGRILIKLLENHTFQKRLSGLIGIINRVNPIIKATTANILENKARMKIRIKKIANYQKCSTRSCILTIVFILIIGMTTLTRGYSVKSFSGQLISILPESLFKNICIYLPFENNSDKTFVTNNKNLKIFGNINYNKNGLLGTSLVLNGQNTIINLKNLPTNELSLSFWIYTNNLTFTEGEHLLCAEGLGAFLSVKANCMGSLELTSNSNNMWELNNYYNRALYENDWTFVTFTFDDKMGKLYLNGILTDICHFNQKLVDGTVWIGGGEEGNFWNGEIDEIIFFNRAITADEIRNLYTLSTSLLSESSNAKMVVNNNVATENFATGQDYLRSRLLNHSSR